MSSPAAFLDRDGTIIVDRDYLGTPAGVTLERNAVLGLRSIAALGYKLIVVSNQSGIGRGYLSYDDAVAVNQRVAELLEREGVHILDWYFCPHRSEEGCDCRKPLPGMAKRAARVHDVDLRHSIVIGDKRSDIEMANAIGAAGFLVLTGYGRDHAEWARQNRAHICRDLLEVGEIIRCSSGSRGLRSPLSKRHS